MNTHLESDLLHTIENKFSMPLFIVGSPRSGTTLLQALVCSTDEYAIPPEEDFILRLYDKYNGLTSFDEKTLDGFVHDLYASPTFGNWDVDPGYLRKVLDLCSIGSYSDLIRGVYIAYGTKNQSTNTEWGSKVPYFVNHIGRIARLLPNAKFIHLVRDGRDVLCSMRSRARKGATHFETRTVRAALQWRNLVSNGMRQGAALPPSRFLSVRYRDLVSKPRAALNAISAFLGCDMSSTSENFYKAFVGNETLPSEKMDRYLRPQIKSDHVEQWRKILTDQEVLDYEMVAGRMLEAFGFPLKFKPAPVSRRIRGATIKLMYAMYGKMPVSLKRSAASLLGQGLQSGNSA